MSTQPLTLPDYLSYPVKVLSWILSLPIRLLTVIVRRARTYDPEKVPCPACGYRGERGSNYKSCSIRFVLTSGVEKAAIRHECFRCFAPFYSGLYVPDPGKWMSPTEASRLSKIKSTIANGVV